MSNFYDAFISNIASNATDEQDHAAARSSSFGAWTMASIVAVPLLVAGWPQDAFAQSCCGSESPSNSASEGPGGGGADGADVGGSSVAGVQTGGAQDVSGLMGDQGERVIIIDVRPRADFAKSHLKNAKNLEVRYSPVLRDHVFDKAALGADKSARIVVYGASATDPAAAAVVRQATAEGFSNVIWMRGGFAEWIAARLPVTEG